MTVDWNRIRTFNKSQNNSFEELVCQLANEEEFPNKKRFYRVAAPDGGVEAYCVLENGDEYGWQAKYFNSMGNSQWSQIFDSFKTALNTHPKLTKYYICVPLDREDPRRNNQMWFMDKWNKKVEDWKQYAKDKGRLIEIEYWGSFELLHRLSQKKHAGRNLFWFSEYEFSDEWFKQQVEYSVSNLGKRYTPEINIDLEIAKSFNFLSRNASFRETLKQSYHELLVALNKTLNLIQEVSFLEEEKRILTDVKKSLIKEYSCSQEEGIGLIGVSELQENIELIEEIIMKIENKQDTNKESSKVTNTSNYSLNNLWEATYSFSEFTQESFFKLADSPNLLLTGPAGIGKSHLLADIALNRINNDKSCVLILGQHFSTDEAPWTQILKSLLRVQCNESELLGALNAKAEAEGERILFIIDAINEGRGKYFWADHIHGFVEEFKKYPWIGLVLSIRSSYEQLITPEYFITETKIVKVDHSGFEGIEYLASTQFFTQYEIEQPSIPLLHPEFSNPLFLKLFCEGLQRSGLKKVPKGFKGFSSIINFFIDSIDTKLSIPSLFNYPSNQRLTRKVITELIKCKIGNQIDHISFDVAYEIADKILSKYSNKRRFLDALISEGLLSKNIVWLEEKNDYEEYVYLAYERFEDHLITSYLLDTHLDQLNANALFQEPCELVKYVDNNHHNQGILEALAIQIPERTGKEIYEFLNETQRNFKSVKEAFINSLLWRSTENIPETSKDYLNKYIMPYSYTRGLFFQLIYSICLDPNHIYNVDRFHEFMMKFTLAKRDSFWTTYLHDQDDNGSAIQRLINWSLAIENHSRLAESSRILGAICLGWIFTSTNITLRNTATKGLMTLLKDNMCTTTNLLMKFKNVNDPYVQERVYAAAYGAVLNSENLSGIEQLSTYIIDSIFCENEVYTNVLVRDYARNIVEYSSYKGLFTLENSDVIRPPYKSGFPTSFPTNEEIDLYKLSYSSADFKDHHWAQNAILRSMVTEYGRGTGSYGDFGRYTFQSAVSPWDKFNSNDLSNYACKLIFEKYGYDKEEHGDFDRRAGRGDRYRNKKERIGKKYQWIALYEVLARLSDNHKMKDPSYQGRKKYMNYQGPWEPFVRNIDPTFDDSSRVASSFSEKINDIQYTEWSGSNEDWLTRDKDLPDPQSLLLTNIDGEEWLVLERHSAWREPLNIGLERNGTSYKRMWYQVRSYLVKEKKETQLVNWLKKEHLMGRWFPEGGTQHYIFNRELYWSPAYRYFNPLEQITKNWKSVYKNKFNGQVIAKVLPTTEEHRHENEGEPHSYSYLAPADFILSKMKLQCSFKNGEWLDEKGELVCIDASTKSGDSSVFIIRKNAIMQFLAENNLRIIWTCLGEKQVIEGAFNTGRSNDVMSDWLEISGVFKVNQGEIDGELRKVITGQK